MYEGTKETSFKNIVIVKEMLGLSGLTQESYDREINTMILSCSCITAGSVGLYQGSHKLLQM